MSSFWGKNQAISSLSHRPTYLPTYRLRFGGFEIVSIKNATQARLNPTTLELPLAAHRAIHMHRVWRRTIQKLTGF